MGQSQSEITRRLAEDIADLHHVDEVIGYRGDVGSIRFRMREYASMDTSRITSLPPDGWIVNLVITGSPFTSAYIEEE